MARISGESESPGPEFDQPSDGLIEDATDTRLSSDEPIRFAEQDLLGRAPFAAALARTIERAPRGAGFVIAVTGSWGDGKTSVLNMAIEQLQQRRSAELVRFNPWLFSGAEDLLARFFSEVAAQLPDEGLSRTVATRLRRCAGAVAPFRSLPWLGGVLQTSGELAQGTAGLLAPDAGGAHERAQELREALRELRRPIVVFIDDIDRLRSQEINEVMRLVRLVGDFPNLVYVLAFEPRRVEVALSGVPEQPALGAEYLEKIIQAVFDMPATDARARERVLQRAISEAVGDVSELTFSMEAFSNVYAHGFHSLFASLRDVRRFANALPAVVDLVGDEVEVSDLLALEALRLLEPESYGVIVSDTDAFTATRQIGPGAHDAAAESRRRATAKRALDVARLPEPTGKLMRELFPASARHLGGSNFGSSWESSWRRERRVASREVLEVYLTRGVMRGAVPQSLMRRLLAALEDRPTLDALISELDGAALEELLRRLEDYEGRLETPHPENLIGALLDSSERLRTGRDGLFDAGANIALSRALLRILRGRDPDEVDRIVRAVNSDSLWGRYELVLLVGHVEGAGSGMVSEASAKELEAQVVDDVLAASAQRLCVERDVAALLGMACWTDADRLRERLQDWLENPNFLLALLRSATLESRTTTVGHPGLRRGYQLDWRGLVQLADQDRLAEAVLAAASDLRDRELSDMERHALEQALRYAEDPLAAEADQERWPNGHDN